MSGKLQGRVAIVTGAGRGNGRAIALGLAQQGAEIACVDLDPATANDTAVACIELGARAEPFQADIADPASVAATVDKVVHRLGVPTVLVNNAGIMTMKSFLELPLTEWDAVLQVNLRGTFIVSQVVAGQMVAAGRGAIVNISSRLGSSASPNSVHYNVSKAGVTMLTKCMALELAPKGIRVNAIGPGPILTDMTRERAADPRVVKAWEERIPLGRIGMPEDLVGAAVFLVSDDAAYITGQVIFVDGGASVV